MNAETNLLSAIYQNADMGCSSIEKIIPKIADNELRSEVTSQLRRYRRSYNRVCSELHAERTEPKKLNPFTKAMSDIAPQIVRRIFGAKHSMVIPMSAIVGGTFMVICDIAARTLTAPSELPVGTVTALIGAPFFAYVFFRRRKKA